MYTFSYLKKNTHSFQLMSLVVHIIHQHKMLLMITTSEVRVFKLGIKDYISSPKAIPHPSACLTLSSIVFLLSLTLAFDTRTNWVIQWSLVTPCNETAPSRCTLRLNSCSLLMKQTLSFPEVWALCDNFCLFVVVFCCSKC